MKPNPKPKKHRRKKIDWEGFAVPKQSIKLSPYEYSKLKASVHKRDNWLRLNPNCTELYDGPDLEIHHIIPRGRLRLDTAENMATLCHVCHRLVEDKILYLDFKELLKNRKFLTG